MASYAHIILKMKKINVQFRRHTSNMYVADDAFTVRLEAQEIEDRPKARKETAEEIRRFGAVKITAVQIMLVM